MSEHELSKTNAEIATAPHRTVVPNVDILEREHEIVLFADMPSVASDGIDITLEKGELTIHGTNRQSAPADHRRVYTEFEPGDYRRVFTVTDSIDRDKITARVRNGVLELILPKVDQARTRRIPVQAG